MSAFTLLSLAGITPRPPVLSEAVLVLIDYQNEYLDGPLRLVAPEAAIGKAALLLAAARKAGGKVIHVAHRGGTGGPFDRNAPRGAIVAALAPLPGEAVVEKIRANGFAETDLAAHIGPAGTAIIVAGFMTHNCVSSTVRAAADLGYAITVASDASGTRDLPGPDGGVIPAATIHAAELAGLADRHGCVCPVAAITG